MLLTHLLLHLLLGCVAHSSAHTHPHKTKIWVKEVCCGFRLWVGWLNRKGKPRFWSLGPCRLETIGWIQDKLPAMVVPPSHPVSVCEFARICYACVSSSPVFLLSNYKLGMFKLPGWENQEFTFSFFLKIIFIYFWLFWVFVAVCGLSLATASEGYSWMQCLGFSLRWLLLLQAQALGTLASVLVACDLSSCGTWAQLP